MKGYLVKKEIFVGTCVLTKGLTLSVSSESSKSTLYGDLYKVYAGKDEDGRIEGQFLCMITPEVLHSHYFELLS